MILIKGTFFYLQMHFPRLSWSNPIKKNFLYMTDWLKNAICCEQKRYWSVFEPILINFWRIFFLLLPFFFEMQSDMTKNEQWQCHLTSIAKTGVEGVGEGHALAANAQMWYRLNQKQLTWIWCRGIFLPINALITFILIKYEKSIFSCQHLPSYSFFCKQKLI